MKGRRFLAFVLAALMSLSSFSSASAEDEVTEASEPEVVSVEYLDNGVTRTTYEMYVTTDENGVATAAIDSSFTMTTYHRGGDRKYSGNMLGFSAIITDSSGNACSNQVRIELWDYNTVSALSEYIVDADGCIYTFNGISITANRTYYFKYYLASGSSSTTLKVRMVINTWTE